jgi:hypothetical protein
MRTVVSIALAALVSISVAFAADDMTAFPPAEEGMTRHVIRLPKQQDENAFKVELIIGKTANKMTPQPSSKELNMKIIIVGDCACCLEGCPRQGGFHGGIRHLCSLQRLRQRSSRSVEN